MSIANLSTEILQKVYDFANLNDIVHLAQTSKKTYEIFLGRRLHILERGLQNSFGPIPELFKLVISTESERRVRRPVGTEIRRNALVDKIIEYDSAPKLTLETMKKMVPFGRVAVRWTEVYPQLRWRIGYKNRRFLKLHEQERLCRVVYVYWMYCNLFHDLTYTQFDPSQPDPHRDDPRLRLLSTLSTMDLIQLSEFIEHIAQLIETDLYPSDSSVCDDVTDLSKLALSKIAWGGGAHYRFLRDCLLKFDPSDLIYLIDQTSTKAQRMCFLSGKGQFFQESRASLTKALEVVVMNRATTSLETLLTFPSTIRNLQCGKSFFQKSEHEEVRFGIADLEDEKLDSEGRSSNVFATDGDMGGKW